VKHPKSKMDQLTLQTGKLSFQEHMRHPMMMQAHQVRITRSNKYPGGDIHSTPLSAGVAFAPSPYGIHHHQQHYEGAPGSNLFIRGLRPDATDDSLQKLCEPYGAIVSAKAIVDREARTCKGYGFVMFKSQENAAVALKGINAEGRHEAAYAKVSSTQTNASENIKDSTNLYFSNLPEHYGDEELQSLLKPFGNVVSSRILRDHATGLSRGVGFARMESTAICEAVIQRLNGVLMDGATESLQCKFADNPHARKRNRFFTRLPNQLYQNVYPSEYLQEFSAVPALYPQVVYDGKLMNGTAGYNFSL